MNFNLKPHKPKTEGALAFLKSNPKPVLIGADWHVLSDTFQTFDPATGAEISSISRAGSAQVDAAVAAAQAAMVNPDWADMLPMARQALLWKIADLIDAHADELAELESLDQGKTFATARFAEIPAAASQFRYYAGLATKIHGQTIRPSIGYAPKGKKVTAYTRPHPIGVVAAITPWNSPLLMAAMKLAPALCAGCTVILKPAEETSLTSIRLAQLIQQAGMPEGVVNLLTGYGHEVGDALAKHEGVAKVAFTGSTEVGKLLLGSARGNLKKLTLELGGKSPAIVMNDADMAITIDGIARGIFANSGQVCVASSRIYAHRDIFDELTDKLSCAANNFKLGHGLDPDSELGPLVSVKQADIVSDYVERGQEQGAELIAGGQQIDGVRSFYRPTVLTNVREDMPLMREEIFGPVTAVTPFDETDEALALANDTDYGLAASVWTENLSFAHRMADQINAGTVWVNCHSYFSPELPKGGLKQSGWGVENNLAGLANYLEDKTVCVMV